MKKTLIPAALLAATLMTACGEPASPPAPPADTVAAAPAAPPAPAGTSGGAADPAPGARTYRQACAFCHDGGGAGAPRLGDAAAWAPRLAQGRDALYEAALRGKGAMPARGGNPDLATASVKDAVDYLVGQSR